jgi:hypothetical protein
MSDGLWFSRVLGRGVQALIWICLIALAILIVLSVIGCAVNMAREGSANVDMHENYEGTNRVLNIKAK